jgi:hypothetical protein
MRPYIRRSSGSEFVRRMFSHYFHGDSDLCRRGLSISSSGIIARHQDHRERCNRLAGRRNWRQLGVWSFSDITRCLRRPYIF